MQALVLTAPHEFEIGDIPRPEPKENEVLCRVRAIAIASATLAAQTQVTGTIADIAELAATLPPRVPVTVIIGQVARTRAASGAEVISIIAARAAQ